MKWMRKVGYVAYNAFIKFVENALSKKFLVFITATILLITGLLPPEHWAAIALAVLGVVSAIDFKHGAKTLGPRVGRSSEVEGPPPEEPPDIP